MPYKYDASDSNGLVKENDYEVTIERMEVRTIPSGKMKLTLMYRIRDDVEQSFKNKCLFEDIWTEKDNPEVFNRKRINQLLGTQDVKDGQEFADINEVINFLLGANLIIHVTIEFDTFHEEDVNNVAYYKSSKHKPQTIGSVEETPVEQEPAKKVEKQEVIKDNIITDDDLPWMN